MSTMQGERTLTPGRVRTARAIAIAADFLQIVVFPVFAPGAASLINDALDLAVALALFLLVGWHWAFLPTFAAELVPFLDLVPTWTAAVFFATRDRKRKGSSRGQAPAIDAQVISSTPVKPEEDSENPRASVRSTSEGGSMSTEKATFAAGCFWGVEAAFRQVPGVIDTAVGYSGGHTQNPSYKQVCTDTTGHAEVVEVTYDPSRVSYDQLLETFWNEHDPTQLNRQGPDVGTQYRSVIFYHTPEQQAAAIASKEQLERAGRFSRPIVTEIVPAATFNRAEEYHQQYLEKRGLASCNIS
jgi:peptide-methionine (S)-S-oxide reductase